MPITVKIGKGAKSTSVQLEMDIRKSVNGDLMIFDHGDIDIVLSTTKNKVIAFPKETMNDISLMYLCDQIMLTKHAHFQALIKCLAIIYEKYALSKPNMDSFNIEKRHLLNTVWTRQE